MSLPAAIASSSFHVGAKGRVVIETVQSIREGVWAAAPQVGGHDMTAEVRAMRDEDNRISDEAFTRRRCRFRWRQRRGRRRLARPPRPVSAPPRRVALDASALLAWVLRERGFDTVDKVLAV